jgi:hypothetical protein
MRSLLPIIAFHTHFPLDTPAARPLRDAAGVFSLAYASRAAMLTGVVNIAVFAALRFCVKRILLVSAVFKPVCGPRPRDVSCSGRQKRQDRGKIAARKWHETAWSAAKTARFWWDGGHFHVTTRVAATG